MPERASISFGHTPVGFNTVVVSRLQSVLVSVFFSKPQRLNVYVDNNLIAPTNAQWNADNTDYTLKKPVFAGTNAQDVN